VWPPPRCRRQASYSRGRPGWRRVRGACAGSQATEDPATTRARRVRAALGVSIVLATALPALAVAGGSTATPAATPCPPAPPTPSAARANPTQDQASKDRARVAESGETARPADTPDLRRVSYGCLNLNHTRPNGDPYHHNPGVFKFPARTQDGRRIEPITLYSWGQSRVSDVWFLGGYLTATSIEVVSQSGVHMYQVRPISVLTRTRRLTKPVIIPADPGATATERWWRLGDLALHSSPDGPKLISWSGSAAPGDRGPRPYDPEQRDSLSLKRAGNRFLRFLKGHGSPPDPDATLTVKIHPPGRPPVKAKLSCQPGPHRYQRPMLCDGGKRTGLSLLDAKLYKHTPLKRAFSAIRRALTGLVGPGGPLEGLDLIAGGGSRTNRSHTSASRIRGIAGSKIWGIAASFLDAGRDVNVNVAGASTKAVQTERDLRFGPRFSWRTGFHARDFKVKPSECSHRPNRADCPFVARSQDELVWVTGPCASRSCPGGGQGGGPLNTENPRHPHPENHANEAAPGAGTAAPSTPRQSVQTVAQLLPRNDTGGVAPRKGASREARRAPASPSTGSELSRVHQSALAPSLDAAPGHGSPIPWLAAVAGLALVALGVLRWRRERRGEG
jgi:hypothetical protein